MVAVLNLDQRPDRGRSDEDAHMDLAVDGEAVRLQFELKSAPVNGDFGTGRDTGIAQLRRWSLMHFVFAWFLPRDNVPQRLWYGSPVMMRDWNRAEQDYLAPDLVLTRRLPEMVGEEMLDRLLGPNDIYTYDELRRLLKDQWNASAANGRPNRYLENADVLRAPRAVDCLYSRQTALEAVRERAHYLLARGSTVNNRKISRRYVMDHCQEITGPRWSYNFEQAVLQAVGA